MWLRNVELFILIAIYLSTYYVPYIILGTDARAQMKHQIPTLTELTF